MEVFGTPVNNPVRPQDEEELDEPDVVQGITEDEEVVILITNLVIVIKDKLFSLLNINTTLSVTKMFHIRFNKVPIRCL